MSSGGAYNRIGARLKSAGSSGGVDAPASQLWNVMRNAPHLPTPLRPCACSTRSTDTAKGDTIVSIKNALASVAVKDLSSAVQWYETLFGRPPDSRQGSEVAEWRCEEGGCLQVYENAERAGYGSVTLAVTSLDEQVADLKKSGLDPGRQMTTETLRVVMITDQDGNSIAFVQSR